MKPCDTGDTGELIDLSPGDTGEIGDTGELIDT